MARGDDHDGAQKQRLLPDHDGADTDEGRTVARPPLQPGSAQQHGIWVHYVVSGILVCIIALQLLFLNFGPATAAPRPSLALASDINGIVPEFPLVKTRLSALSSAGWPDAGRWLRGEVSLSEWDALFHAWHTQGPRRGGFLAAPAPEHGFLLAAPARGVKPPYPQVFSMAVFHQQHCLTAVLKDFVRLYAGEPPQGAPSHVLHCFNYLRQAVSCCGDATLERSARLGGEDGQEPERVCKDYARIARFAAENVPVG